MMLEFESFRTEIEKTSLKRHFGQVISTARNAMHIAGLAQAALGDRVRITQGMTELWGEISAINGDTALALPESDPEGMMIGALAELTGPAKIAPDLSWRGRIIDPLGRPLDGSGLREGRHPRSLSAPPPLPAERGSLGRRLATGVAVFDTLLPLVRGQRIGLFAGSGVGKSTLLGQFARGVEADVTVIALVGERGRELREFTENVLGPEGLARSVIIAATSDQSALMRRRCLHSAMSVAEYFRDQGLHVLLLADSITRFAEAHRESALASGEAGSLRGYPPSTAHAIMSLCERAGPGRQDGGAITAVFSVLVAGSDMEEPVADILRGTIDGHIVLSRDIAERGRYPATDLLRSVSRSLPSAASADENLLIAEARRMLSAYDRAELMIQSGLYQRGSDPVIDRAVTLWPLLDGFLAEPAPAGGTDASFARLAAILRTGLR